MAAEALEQSMLESKDKEQLLAIAQALGIKTTSRAAKATLIDKILETTSSAVPAAAPTTSSTNGRSKTAKAAAPSDAEAVETAPETAPEPGDTTDDAVGEPAVDQPAQAGSIEAEVILGPDGEPLADWEIELIKSGEVQVTELPSTPAALAPTANGPFRGRSRW